MSILDRMPEITRANFEAMAQLKVEPKPKPKEEKLQRPDKVIKLLDLSGNEREFNIRDMVHSFYVTNGSSRYFIDIPERIEIDKDTFDSVMFVATGERFYKPKKQPNERRISTNFFSNILIIIRRVFRHKNRTAKS